MGTNYISWKLQPKEAKEKKETKFIECIGSFGFCASVKEPKDYKNVIFIAHDKRRGDVFLAFNDDADDIHIYFGKKGDEFDD